MPVSRLTKELAFYRKYHRNPLNVALHIVGIPTILGTSLYNLTPFRLFGSNYFTLGSAVGLYYFYYYYRLDPKFGGVIGAVVAIASLLFGKLSATNPHFGLTWSLWTTGWVAQFIGHGLFEGRAPALFDNLNQALILAPYFAILEMAALLRFSFAEQEIAKVDALHTKSR